MLPSPLPRVIAQRLDQAKGVGGRAGEAVVPRHALGEGGDQALAVDAQAEAGLNGVDEVGDVERGGTLCEYVESHVDMGHTFFALLRSAGSAQQGRGFALELSDGGELGFKCLLKNGEEGLAATGLREFRV